MAFGEGAVSFGNIKVSTQLLLLFSKKKKKSVLFFNLIFFFLRSNSLLPTRWSVFSTENQFGQPLGVVAFLCGSLNPKVLDVPSQGMSIVAVESYLLAQGQESPCP